MTEKYNYCDFEMMAACRAVEALAQPEQPAKIDIDYWVSSCTQIIEALAKAGFTLMSNANGFGLEPAPQPEQEPVVWMKANYNYNEWSFSFSEKDGWVPLYTAPPQRKPLTDEAGAVINAARAAMDASTEAHDGEGGIKIASDLAASLSLCLDEYDRAIEAATWVGLTDEEIQTTWDSVMDGAVFTRREVYKAIEAKLKEKNT